MKHPLTITGFIPRHGKHVSLSVICLAIKKTYDFAPTFAYQLTSAAGFISKSSGDGKTWIDLNDIAAPNVIEHDASLLREFGVAYVVTYSS